jgi:predicted nucleic acid-binding protein
MNDEFVDTNILVKAQEIVRAHHRHLGARRWALSVQVRAEFYSTVTGKLKMTTEQAEDVIRPLGVWTIHRPGHADLSSAISLQRRHKLS